MSSELRLRFMSTIETKWIMNNHCLKEISCVYAMVGCSIDFKTKDVFYIGSTTKLNSRYKSHAIPAKVQELGLFNFLYFLPMDKGFYDYEIKLIGKLKPLFNKQHKGRYGA